MDTTNQNKEWNDIVKRELNKITDPKTLLYKLHSTIVDNNGDHEIQMAVLTPCNPRNLSDPTPKTTLKCTEKKKYKWYNRKWIWKVEIKEGEHSDPNIKVYPINLDNKPFLLFVFNCELGDTWRGHARFLPILHKVYGAIARKHDGTVHLPGAGD